MIETPGRADLLEAEVTEVAEGKMALDERRAGLRDPHPVGHALKAQKTPDEVRAFQLYSGEGVTMLFVEYGKRDRIWVARDAKHFFHQQELDKLPHGALAAMHLVK